MEVKGRCSESCERETVMSNKITILKPVRLKKSCLRRVRLKQAWKLGLIMNFGIIGLLGVCWILVHTQLHLCLTPSLDGIRILLFYKTPVREIKHGDIVFIKGHDYKYLGVQPYAKRVIGFPGDVIVRTSTSIRIGTRVLPLIEKTTEGHPLTPIAYDVVPEGYLFVAGDHPRSIDSRYEEFGLVPMGKVWGKGVFTW